MHDPDAADREVLPFTISIGQSGAPTIAESVAGEVITLDQIGYGIAAFGSSRSLTTGEPPRGRRMDRGGGRPPWPCSPS